MRQRKTFDHMLSGMLAGICATWLVSKEQPASPVRAVLRGAANIDFKGRVLLARTPMRKETANE
jgi:hypothetical protein